jgi:Cell division protein CrgA
MPESRKRRGATYTPPVAQRTTKKKRSSSPPWVGATILAFFLAGIAYLLCYYLSNGDLPIKSIEGWNIFVGFGFIIVGFAALTQWR